MSDFNQSGSVDSSGERHRPPPPESSGCSNDDFEQLDAPGNYYYPDDDDNIDAEAEGSTGAIESGAYDYQYDQEEPDLEVSSTSANAGEDEAEEDRYGAGASPSEAEAYVNSEPLIDLGTEDGYGFDTSYVEEPVQPSAPVSEEIDAAIQFDEFASTTAADILSTIAPSAFPPSAHFAEPVSSTNYNDFELEEENQEVLKNFQLEEEEEFVPEERNENFSATATHEPLVVPLLLEPEQVTSTTVSDVKPDVKSPPADTDKRAVDSPKGGLLRSLDPRLRELIYWRNVRNSGLALASLLVLLVSLALCSVISVFAYLSLVLLTLTFSFVIYKKILAAVQKSGDDHPFKSLLELEINLDEDKLRSQIQTSLQNVNVAVQELRHLFLVEDVFDSIKFGILLWVLTYIGSWFSGMALIITAVVLLFTVPILYEKYQVQIDNYVGLAKTQINNYLNIIQSKLPFLKKKEKSQ